MGGVNPMVQQMPSPYPNMPNMMKYIPTIQKMIIPTQPIMMIPGGYMGYPPQNNNLQGHDKSMQMTPNFSNMNQMNIPYPLMDKNMSNIQMNIAQMQNQNNQMNVSQMPVQNSVNSNTSKMLVPEISDDVKIEKS